MSNVHDLAQAKDTDKTKNTDKLRFTDLFFSLFPMKNIAAAPTYFAKMPSTEPKFPSRTM